ncbi:MAG: hypothetical protein IJQ12_07770 [Lachnospiraceae bacterium]|nr:hypothetical protein [Lachnospiraceae bacterium]
MKTKRMARKTMALIMSFCIFASNGVTAIAAGPADGPQTHFEDSAMSDSLITLKAGHPGEVVSPQSLSAATLLSLAAIYIATYQTYTDAAYHFGMFCRNNGVGYWAGQSALYLAFGGALPNIVNVPLAIYYDNGWNSR